MNYFIAHSKDLGYAPFHNLKRSIKIAKISKIALFTIPAEIVNVAPIYAGKEKSVNMCCMSEVAVECNEFK